MELGEREREYEMPALWQLVGTAVGVAPAASFPTNWHWKPGKQLAELQSEAGAEQNSLSLPPVSSILQSSLYA